MQPANHKARSLLAKLTTLADRGVNGERDAAKRKLAKLRARYDFTKAAPDGADIFDGVFVKAIGGERYPVHTFEPAEMVWACNVKWAIETACKIPCTFRGLVLMAEARPATVTDLERITKTIAGGFVKLWETYSRAPGVNAADQPVFLMGLYDGMMNENREAGALLPARSRSVAVPRAKKRSVAAPIGITLHPYSVAVGLGKQIRFSVPLNDITAELENLVKPQIC